MTVMTVMVMITTRKLSVWTPRARGITSQFLLSSRRTGIAIYYHLEVPAGVRLLIQPIQSCLKRNDRPVCRALLVRLYNKYTEENCMTFRKFARKFKQKANEWEMIKESYDSPMVGTRQKYEYCLLLELLMYNNKPFPTFREAIVTQIEDFLWNYFVNGVGVWVISYLYLFFSNTLQNHLFFSLKKRTEKN